MTMKVLIALDATPQCGEIVAAVAARPWPADTSFLLLHVLDPFPFTKVPLALERAREAAEARLKEIGRRLCAGGWALEEQVVLGRARQQITKTAASLRTDLIVVGSNDPGALTGLLLGSTARAVVRHAPCSVEIVRTSGNQDRQVRTIGMNVLVATDGSDCSTIALRSLANRPWPVDSKFRVISIPHPSMPLCSFPDWELKDVIAVKDAKRYAESGAGILRAAGLDAESDTLVPHESDGREIVKEAERWHAQMIVLGSHGRRGFERLNLGSVSEHVAFHARCSVEVIRGLMPAKKKAKPQKGVEYESCRRNDGNAVLLPPAE
jgi:nucleotide-binding universal stress UspA family protein